MLPSSLIPRRRRPPEAEIGTTRGLFFNRLWIAGAMLVLAIGVAAGEPALSLLALLILTTAALGALWNRWSLTGIEYRRELAADRAFPGDEIAMTISIVNRKPLPVPWLTIEDELSESLRPLDRETSMSGTSGRRVLRIVTHVRPYERVSWRVPLACTARGFQTLGPVTMRAGDPFGFFANRRSFDRPAEIVVYPRLTPLPELGFPPRQALGETRAVRQFLADPARVIGVRDYRPDDPFRSIHWKASARQGALQVRVAEPTTLLQLAIFLNLDTFEHYWEGLDVIAAERAIEIAASLARWAVAERYATGIYANGILARSDQPLRVPPGRGPAQLPRILEGLAKVSPYSTVAFASVLRTGAARLPLGSTIVVIAALLPDAVQGHLARLVARGHRVVLVPAGAFDLPAIRGLIVQPLDLATAAAAERDRDAAMEI